ncbi:MAG: 16S rRNA (cytosine(1402)-N(4))-methyltransferase [Candidatus Pelagibacter sp. TMED64]|nr:hypothetical protein [Candidatus Pelagibacter sp.]OUU65884.1 MAG: 16S rRNA (cytosine(1402)-N(4))-methyltransferase [Candidatus Pelagibacter sp. TMED64]|tara:strand:+ start:2418 stop:3434 length:1017 start_codon:yes stop_codon:yes gene_type:complete
MNATMGLENVDHYPVMLDQILSIISPQHGGMFIDCTFGAGGYSKAILKYPNTEVIAIDRDKNSEKYAKEISTKHPSRFKFINTKFSNLEEMIKKNLEPKAIIFDLGFSSMQINDSKRGFSFQKKGPLDMRMGINNFSAKDVVNNMSESDLAQIIKNFGDEKEGKKIANKIINFRKKNLINTSEQLSLIVKSAKRKVFNSKINPSTKTFQALRIFVNKEISELKKGLDAATRILKDNGILIVVNFHSIEDKIIKSFFRFYSESKSVSRHIPIKEDNKKGILYNLTQKKIIRPKDKEIKENNRSRSAKLRFAIRTSNKFYYSNKTEELFKKYFEVESINI